METDSNIDAIRHAWREQHTPSLDRRRRISILSAIGLVDFALISLYQLGVVRHLPDFPGKIFDSDKVNASRKAFGTGIPDGTMGALLYAGTMVLAAAKGTRKTGRPRIASVALAGTVAAGAVGAAQYLVDMARKQERVCPYCVLGAVLNFAMVPPVIAELRETFAGKTA